ncbi:hypothetical protein Cgig2_020841 [Carnegiea gigantea]|uniref:Heparan-alpha-glucosaminide N-acetyltransferase catalytic domain-containing protein n=1 Tax=Carnegiea gigantea TaxID=171969 RepID=A0A9Q1KJB4_9CARY|nr:hypothetical protein Cgig2_020841 [Carnegiea gigantea]
MQFSVGTAMENRENRTPLLENSPSPPSQRVRDLESEIVPFFPPLSEAEKDGSPPLGATEAPLENRRLVSLDVFRGLTIALMILVDDAGGAFPSLNHSPWFGVTIADFVMPFFLFIVGVSIGLVFKKIPNKSTATKKVIMRAVTLFLLGILLQGGFFHGRKDLTYGVDMKKIRWLGVLQRISIGYLLASISEIWLVKNVAVDSALAFARRYYIQWLSTVLICVVYVCLLYGIYVPTWKYELQATKSKMFISSIQTLLDKLVRCTRQTHVAKRLGEVRIFLR